MLALIKRSGFKRDRFEIKHPTYGEEHKKYKADQGEFVPNHGFLLQAPYSTRPDPLRSNR
jgi:hypothetical protein